MDLIQPLLVAVFIALVLYGAWSDARELRIPNWLSLSLLALFFPAAVSAGLAMEVLTWHLIAGVLMLVLGFALFAAGVFGGGDAKLMSACALWLGWDLLLPFAVAVVLIGGALSILVILLRKGVGMWPDWLVRCAIGLFEPGKAVPYGIAISAGAVILAPRMDTFPPAWREIMALIWG